MTHLDRLVSWARTQWPEMPEDVEIRYVAQGTRVILKKGCCKRTYIDLRPLKEEGQVIGYARYHEDTNRLFVRMM